MGTSLRREVARKGDFMKQILKRSLSVILAITIIFSSAYVGLNEIDFSKIFVVKAEAASESDLTFTLNSDGESYSVTECDVSASGDLVIPDEYNDLPVTSIGNYAFQGCYNISKVTIPSTVTNIGDGAFDDCISLDKVVLSEGLSSIGKYAFSGCKFLQNIEIPESVTQIGEGAFWGCYKFTEIILSENIKELKYGVFGYCTGLDKLYIRGTLENIGDYVFFNCNTLDFVIYGGSEVSWKALSIGENNDGLNIAKVVCDAVYVAETEEFMYSVNKDNHVRILEYSGDNSTVEIPSQIENMPVTSIGSKAFSTRFDIETIVVPLSVKFIDANAFGTNHSLKYVFYEGSEQDKNDIELGENNIVSNAIWHYDGRGHTVSDWKIKTEATCTAKGLKQKECTICGFVHETEEIPMKDHVKSDEWKIKYEAACTTTGLKQLECVNCSYVYEQETIPAEGHVESEWIIGSEPTCTTGGNRYKRCINCMDIIEGESLPAKGHTESDWKISSHPTCSASGSKYKQCTDCKVRLATETIPAKGHNESDWMVDQKPTCTQNGLQFKKCTECEVVVQVSSIPATGHTPGSWEIDKKASVYSAGSKHQKCTECGEIVETATIKQMKPSKPKLSKIENTEHGVKITWGKVKGADKYRVYRKTGKTDWEYIGYTSKTSYTDKKAESGKKYYYAVKSRNEAGNSSLSSSLSKYYLADPTLKTPKSTKKGVKLEWSKVKGAEGYVIYYKTGSGSYKKLTTVKGSSKVTYTHTKAKKGKTYTYKVKAYYSKTYSAYSNAKKIKDKY